MSFLRKLFRQKPKRPQSQEVQVFSPVSGDIVDIEDVPDLVFSEKIVGDGVAFDPEGSVVVAPIEGVLSRVFDTNHAFSVVHDSGLELFVHFGIDTIEFNGKGFKRLAEAGQRVSVGDAILEFDLTFLKANAKSILTPLVITNMDVVVDLDKSSGAVEAGKTVVLTAAVKE